MCIRDSQVGAEAWKLLLGVWDFELFAAEETIEVDGRKVTSSSSVTLGKVIRATALFVIGAFLFSWLGRFSEGIAVKRFHFDPARARILRKWLFALGLVILVVLVLVRVHIPLSVFAFLGGTIAIGVGFGMQNLLKNLISGLMLLFERPFSPGDLVEVGTVRGNITEIGIRSSTVRSIDGIDTLIPNSAFLEQNVTNWVYETPRVRFTVRVGVAYGSPAKEVARLLLETARQHPLVLITPEPEALFENFGPDSLEFGLFYWLNINSPVPIRVVASELRFLIDEAFREHQIVISYPQRDVHLDTAAPLRVEVCRKRSEPGS